MGEKKEGEKMKAALRWWGEGGYNNEGDHKEGKQREHWRERETQGKVQLGLMNNQ